MPCKGSQCDCDRELLSNLRGCPRKMAADGCSKFGVHNVSDLLERDRMKLRPEMCRGGEWSRTGHGKEWVEPMREKLGATCSQESVGVHYPMPAASLCVGAFVGYKCQGTTAVLGCAVRIGDGQTWIARPGSPVLVSNMGVRRSRRRTANTGERVWFGSGSVGLELLQGSERVAPP